MLAFWLGNYRLEYKICVLAELTRLFIPATALCATLSGHSLRGLSVLTVYQCLAGNGLFCHLPIKCFLHVDNTYLPFRLKDPQDTTIAMCFPHCTTGVHRQRQLRIVSSMPAPFLCLPSRGSKSYFIQFLAPVLTILLMTWSTCLKVWTPPPSPPCISLEFSVLLVSCLSHVWRLSWSWEESHTTEESVT